MRHVVRCSAVLFLLWSSFAWSAEGLVTVKSPYSAKETADRFEAAVKQKGLNLFARIDHATGAAKIGKTLRPTEVLIFGNPQGGTPLMECVQTAGIDLPLKALVWEDKAGQVWLGYNDPAYLANRHHAANCGNVVQNMSKMLSSIVQEVISR
jgi:uncharacterized protein (DUF302 family)